MLGPRRETDFSGELTAEEQPLRSELFSGDQLEQYGETLGQQHSIPTLGGSDLLLPRLAENRRLLVHVCGLLMQAVNTDRPITPAGEWLLDNFYLIEEQIRLAQTHLPKRYSWQLPRLSTGATAGFPRVYDIALQAIAHGDGRFGVENLTRFVAAYQRTTTLSLGELWAIPIMLRLALIENLRRVAARVGADRRDRNIADVWVDQIATVAAENPKDLILVIADMARSNPPLVSAFVAEFARRLQGQGPTLTLPLTWIEQTLAESGLSVAQLVQAENQQQAADQVSISNTIGSLRLILMTDWRVFVESLSTVDEILRKDPAGIYPQMDFATRDRYRHVIEKIAKSRKLSETDIAGTTLRLATEQHTQSPASHAAHVGYYLIDDGIDRLESALHVTFSLRRNWRDTRARVATYLESILLVTAIGTFCAVYKAHVDGVHGWLIGAVAVLSMFCASQFAVALVNRLAMMVAPPHRLPKMEFETGVPASCRTLVVVPTIMSDADAVDTLVDALEVRFLANRDENIRFALLTDFSDAAREILSGDDEILQIAESGIRRLNDKYGTNSASIFYLLHRPRRWNPQERVWMGVERKRGKLRDLNTLLQGGDATAFSRIVGNIDALRSTRYVITLDSDTQLPRNSARALVEAMAHPLNQPRFDADAKRVIGGYGILQPRVGVSLSSTQRSLYARLHGGDAGIDPYTRAVSDTYQDAFREGSFIGKGIYDVDAFERALKERLPDNAILSHDLLEGCYARSGLLSDVELIEDYPSTYRSDVRRRHRWIRGDWQIARWIMPRVPGLDGRRAANPLSPLSRWKVFDNLRRSLVPPTLTCLLIMGWAVLPSPWFWTAVVLGVSFIPAVGASLFDLSRKPDELVLHHHIHNTVRDAARRFGNVLFTLACLPYETYVSLDAIVRTLARMLITHRHLLQWTPSSDVNRAERPSLIESIVTLWPSWVLAFATWAYLIYARPIALLVAAPVMALWITAPLITYWLSRPLVSRTVSLSAVDTLFVRGIARRTWAFFEELVSAAEHWLPPDNIQQFPSTVIAHRTSPTNIGLALLANLSAYDLGYLTAGKALERCSNTMDTMQKLDREHGHFFNWYDTQTLKPMPPMYVSTVDSGNLCAHLYTLQYGLRELAEQPIVGPQFFDGLNDTLSVFEEVADAAQRTAVAAFRNMLDVMLDDRPSTLGALNTALTSLAGAANALPSVDEKSATGVWVRRLRDQCQDARDELTCLCPWLSSPPLFNGVAATCPIPALRAMPELIATISSSPEQRDEFERFAGEASRCVHARLAALEQRAQQAHDLAQMDFRFLYDDERHLFTIGYNVIDRRRDASYYDLLATETRLGIFVAIAIGQVPQEAWFSLGRLLTQRGRDTALLSWAGSMFEYLMPLIVMPSYKETLLDQTDDAVVRRQIEYGRQRGVPWGISESGYNAVDAAQNYQYRAFGVPGLGLKRGLADDLVIAPYATVLALLVAPEEATQNLRALAALNLIGDFGFFEAVDYTPSRLLAAEARCVIRSFMAHHQGMSLVAIAETALDRPMQRRFVAEPMVQATLPLLQERVPRKNAAFSEHTELMNTRSISAVDELPVRVFTDATTGVPGVQMLSNGRYHVMLTNAGGGYSRWNNLSVTRWREDSTCDNWGMFCYVRDVASGKFWSNTLQPTLAAASSYQATFSEPRVEFNRRDGDIQTYTEIAVSPEDDIELRRVRITNHSLARRTIEVTSYAEVVLGPPVADDMHRVFNNLFVETEILDGRPAILCSRRPRSDSEHWPRMLHLFALNGVESVETTFETDRMRFIGRGNTLANPAAMDAASTLSGTQGAVLEPIVAIRHRFVLEPDQSASLDMVTGVGDTRDAVLALAEKYQDSHLGDRVFDLARTHSQVALRQINVSDADAQLYGRLAGRVIYANPSLRADPDVIASNARGQPGLWAYSISGDLPIVLLQIKDAANIELVRHLVQAHTYWRTKGLAVDLVIWNDDRGGYRQALQDQILGLIAAVAQSNVIDRPGGIFVRPSEQIAAEDRVLLLAVSRAIITDARGSLSEQVKRRDPIEPLIPRLVPNRSDPNRSDPNRSEPKQPADAPLPQRDLLLGNDTGGFSASGREYVVTVSRESQTPVPWANVIANPTFGTVVSESGSVYTWAENAHEFRLTPWSNDPVSDANGEVFYVRDDESGRYWSPTPLPCCGETPYIARHGFGYSAFEHVEDGIKTEVWIYVALDAPVKFTVIKVRNVSNRTRQLSLTGYIEWVLGDVRPKSAMHVVTEIDPNGGALFARNAFNPEFANYVAFFDVDDAKRTLTCDRGEFIGRNGNLRRPAAMSRTRLSGRTGAGMDPCAALQVPMELEAGQSRDVIFRVGACEGSDNASKLVTQFRKSGSASAAFETVRDYWKRTLGIVQVQTPNAALNTMANGWLLYQTIGCRLWGRSGFYQSGGAFGFRDQLQDAMALVHAQPHLLREQILRAASRQFKEGDVQHWWHPPSGRGVRTHCSDDYLWLPLAVWRYITCTGDDEILKERSAFLEGRPVAASEESYYDLPAQSQENADVYEHCVLAIKHGLNFGTHGLPLIGSCDWNDGMNEVGSKGKGESVWLGFFLFDVLRRFVDIATHRGDAEFAAQCKSESESLRGRLEQNAWDGAWYRRAYFDDGSPLGTSTNMECKIDSIAQSWSVLSTAGDPARARIAMNSLSEHLVDREHKIIKLLEPPFDTSDPSPGYIQGYVPGVRENGGQYTHAAVWAAMAFAELNDAERAYELLDMVLPIEHSRSRDAAHVYKVEPYVVAADVYAVAPHTGRGGWTWYTGSAGWLYRLIVESVLGITRTGDTLGVAPCLPTNWNEYTAKYTVGESVYTISVSRDESVRTGTRVTVDGAVRPNGGIPLSNDGKAHSIDVRIPTTAATSVTDTA
ncbi:MAG TPA: glucoamylase family protein [Rudaea sp.]|nr:glucoamylase family protein [Rudaea sp.]